MRMSVVALDGHEVLSLADFAPDATVLDLQDRVQEAGGGLAATQRLVHCGSVLRLQATLREAGVEDGACLTLVITTARVEYRVMQGLLFKKPGDDPEAPKILKLSRRVGSTVTTTGQTWLGPGGGAWVEADPSAEKPGWLLVEGPGFGRRGPLLERIAEPLEEPLVLNMRHPLDEEVRLDLCLRPSQTVAEAKRWIAWRVPGLLARKIVVVRERYNDPERAYRPSDAPSQSVFADTSLLRDTDLRDGDELKYVYMGDIDVDLGDEAKAILTTV